MVPLFLLMNRMARRRSLMKTVQRLKPEKKLIEDEYCRTCLNTEDLVPIFYNKDTEKKRSGDLRLVTGLEIKANDGLSQKICNQCIETLQLALQFRRTSKKTEKALLNMAYGKTKKRLKPCRIKKIPKLEIKVDYDGTFDDCQDDVDFSGNEDDPKVDNEEENLQPAKRKRDIIPNASSYKCNTCNKEFRMKATYKAHMRFHTNYCVCEACGKRCRNNNQLQEHKRARHGLGKIHKCAYCEYSSATKEALTIHERRHTGERPYVCDHCGATFHRRSNLVQHIAIHLPEKNFQCKICNKREKSRKLLQVHEFKRHREKKFRYICPLCKETYARPASVRKHLVTVHSVPRDCQGAIAKTEQFLPDNISQYYNNNVTESRKSSLQFQQSPLQDQMLQEKQQEQETITTDAISLKYTCCAVTVKYGAPYVICGATKRPHLSVEVDIANKKQ